MQPIDWYARRLKAMSAPEIFRRARSAVRGTLDRCLVSRRRRPLPEAALLRPGGDADRPGFRVSDLPVGAWASAGPDRAEAAWLKPLLGRAERIAAHRLSFFDLEERDLGSPIDWNRDHESGRGAPLGFAGAIDYRDPRVAGDAKLVWEPNRHHHLLVLARAYRASGEERFARAAFEQIESWLEQCPYGAGMNWRSPLELAIRLINWVFTLDLVRESGLFRGEFRARLLNAVHLHLFEIARSYSYGSSANNHRIGEAAGVFIGTSYFPALRKAARWRARSRAILIEEIEAQTYPDGGSREQALGYHLFVSQFFLLAGLVARRTGADFPASYWARLERMLEFAAAMAEGGERAPLYGDADDGYVLDLGGGGFDLRALLAIGAALFGRADLKAESGGRLEPLCWLLGSEGRTRFEAVPASEAPPVLEPRAFPDSGCYLLQSGARGGPDRLSVLFKCGELGFGPIAAHGHADALSFTLRAFGRDVFVDPGTYDYFTFPAWREYFRSTRAHNTVEIDRADQSVMLGPFLWGARARARSIAFDPAAWGGRVSGEHDGYARLTDPAIHRRTLDLDGAARTLTIRDAIEARGRHEIAVHFHLAEDCRLARRQGNRLEIDVGLGTVVLELDPRLEVATLAASESPIGGWVSRGYHRRSPSTTIVGRATRRGDVTLTSKIEVARPRAEARPALDLAGAGAGRRIPW